MDGRAAENVRQLALPVVVLATEFRKLDGMQPAKMLVTPGDPAASYLFEKVSQAMPSSGTRMPFMNDPLNAAEIEAIRMWIAAGASAN